MLKKFIAVLLVIMLSIPNIGFALSLKYKTRIDAIVDTMSMEKLERMDSKIQVVQQRKNIPQKHREILSYLEQSIETKLLAGSPVSADEGLLIETEIMKIQNNIAAGINGQLDALMGEFIKLYNVEEKGNLSMSVEMDIEDTQLEGQLRLDNYSAITAGFASQIKTDISAFMSVNSAGEEIEFNMSAFLDYISKEGNIYILLEDLRVNASQIDEIQEIVEVFRTIASEQNYVSIEDSSNTQAIALLESFAPNFLIEDMNQVFAKPLLRAHSMRGDTYILVPTKYACDQGKILGGKFDPFYNSDECSDSQYNRLVEEFLEEDAYVYMTMGEQTVIGVLGQGGGEKMQGTIIFDDNHILSSNFSVTDDINTMDFEYKLKSHISLDADIPDEDLVFSAKLDLDSQNYIRSAEMSMDAKSGEDIFTMDMNLKGGQISGKANFRENGEEMFDINILGAYSNDYLDIKLDFEIFDNPFESSIDIQYVDEEIEGAECYDSYYEDSQYVCYIDKEPSGDTLTGEFDFSSDTSNSNNNLDLFFQMMLTNKQIFKLEMQNRSQQEFKKTEVNKPTNVTPIEKLFPQDEIFY